MPSLLDQSARDELARRARRLTPEHAARWGTLTCPQMLAHVNDMLRMTLGDMPVKFIGSPMPPGVGYLAIHWLPWAKGIPSAPELFRTEGIDWDEEQRLLPELMERVAARDPSQLLPVHPFFGRLSRKSWAVLAYRHTAHHLTQFGV